MALADSEQLWSPRGSRNVNGFSESGTADVNGEMGSVNGDNGTLLYQ